MVAWLKTGYAVWLTFFIYLQSVYLTEHKKITEDDIKSYREQVVKMFQHAYNSYLSNAYPYDELRPLSCDGIDTWGSFSLTLIDALDTLAVMGNFTEFRRVVQRIINTANFNTNINVSVFETNIRVVGGLLSAHLLSSKAGIQLEPGWPCTGPLLRLAENIARRLLPAFQTPTGMPYGTVNLRYGVPKGETPITCTAGVSTFIVEFGTLSRLTGDPIFEETALKALNALWDRRSSVGLVGNHINVQDGKWTALDAGIGAGIDSYYEYLVKGAILLQRPELMEMFKEYYKMISKYMKRDDWFLWVNMASGQVTMPIFQSLETFWPGLLTLIGDIEQALKTLYNYHQIWKQYGFTPEFYDLVRGQVNNRREGYPLRPELIESVMYLYRATRDSHLLEIGIDILESIQHSAWTNCGYATIKNVQDHRVEDRMESFFLAETTKYLYLLFDPSNFIHSNGSCGEVVRTAGGECIIGAGGYIFNTEAHPIDSAAVYCCSSEKKENDLALQNFQDHMDLFTVLDITEDNDVLNALRTSQKRKHRERKQKNVEENVENPLLHSEEPKKNNSVKNNITENLQPLFLDTVKMSNTDKEENLSLETFDKMTTNDSIKNLNETTESGDIDIDQVSNSDNDQIQTSEDVNKDSMEHSSSENLNTNNAPFSSPSPIKVIPVSSTVPGSPESVKNTTHSKSSHSKQSNYEILSCPAQPFLLRLSLMGEMFSIE